MGIIRVKEKRKRSRKEKKERLMVLHIKRRPTVELPEGLPEEMGLIGKGKTPREVFRKKLPKKWHDYYYIYSFRVVR